MSFRFYYLEIEQSDYGAVCFVGYRYGWSDWLAKNCLPGANKLAEHEAWELVAEINADDSFCPMLAPGSTLYQSLIELRDVIV